MADMTIKMTTEEWDKILAILSDAPFKVVNPLIGKILEQARAQAKQAQEVTDADRLVPRLQPVS